LIQAAEPHRRSALVVPIRILDVNEHRALAPHADAHVAVQVVV
jgi:hypothetical protein